MMVTTQWKSATKDQQSLALPMLGLANQVKASWKGKPSDSQSKVVEIANDGEQQETIKQNAVCATVRNIES